MTDQHATIEERLLEAPHLHEAPHVNYMYIFYALCILTAASVIADVVGGGKFVVEHLGATRAKIVVGLLVLTIASCKAGFVMLYFMHLKFEGRWKIVLLAPTMILAMALVAALVPDVGVHYYDVQVPQTLQHAATVKEQASQSGGGAARPQH